MRMKAPHWKRVKWEDLKWKIFHLQWMNKTFPQLRCYYLNQFWYACEMRKINLENSSESFQSSRKSIEIASHPLLIQDPTIEDDEEDGWMKIELMPNSIILNSPSALSLTCVGEVCYSSPSQLSLAFFTRTSHDLILRNEMENWRMKNVWAFLEQWRASFQPFEFVEFVVWLRIWNVLLSCWLVVRLSRSFSTKQINGWNWICIFNCWKSAALLTDFFPLFFFYTADFVDFVEESSQDENDI